MTATDDVEQYPRGKKSIRRMPVAASAMDGTIIRGYRYAFADTTSADMATPLLCIPSDTGNAREFHDFALALLSLKKGSRQIFALDMRGRGRSGHADAETYSPLVEADDLISFCDATGLHNIDVLASGASALAALLMAPRRPGLIRRLIFNDGGPEQDGVGMARTKAIYHKMPDPRDWDDAAAVLRQAKGKNFPVLSEKGWRSMAEMTWIDQDGNLVRDQDKAFADLESHIDFDERQPMLWKEFKMFANRPVLVIRGEHSILLTEELVGKMSALNPDLQEVVAEGQGHVPLLAASGLPQQINDFLNTTEG